MDHNRGKIKCVKWKMEEPNLILGEGVKLHEILDMEEVVVVGHFTSKEYVYGNTTKWMIENFMGILGYTPKCMDWHMDGWLVIKLKERIPISSSLLIGTRARKYYF
jgi:hypothetical protein